MRRGGGVDVASSRQWLVLLVVVAQLGTVAVAAGPPGAPVFSLVRPSAGYRGTVSEDSLLVDLQPPIRAAPDVCAYVITSHHSRQDTPFMIRLVDQNTGTAEIVATRPLNCEQRRNYRLDIAARSCAGLLSANVSVHVKVADVNEFAPVFREASYRVAVDEGRLYQELISLQAHDGDCSPKYGDICRYQLLTKDQPFSIDSEGVVSNTEPLDFERSHNHILSVVAYDCGMKRSQPVTLTVKVNRVCRLGWKGLPGSVEYWPGSGRMELFPHASLELCSVPCEVTAVQTRVSLSTAHIGRGCDRDTASAAHLRHTCGASTDSVELLPAKAPWTLGLHSDDPGTTRPKEGVTPGVADEVMYEFDGSAGAVVPQGVLGHNLSSTFTLNTWMKHSKPLTEARQEDKHGKEHILCLADSSRMNRHHVAVFVRHCRLIVLVRHEPGPDAALNTFQPAEWRWKLPQVCDDAWHHYSVQVQLPDVRLYVDGHLVSSAPHTAQHTGPNTGFDHEADGDAGSDAPEVLDDWPLHPTRGINTTLTIGACWQGTEGRMAHGLHGSLSGVTVAVGTSESPRVLRCLTRCLEALETPAMELLQPSMELLTNTDMTQITIEGDNITNAETLLRRVAYTNSRDVPTPGVRPIDVTTSIVCASGGALRVGGVSSSVTVMRPHRPAVFINGTANFAQEYQNFRAGLRIFPDVTVTLRLQNLDNNPDDLENYSENFETNPEDLGSNPDNFENYNPDDLDNASGISECQVSVYPPLNPDHETLLLPDNLIRDLGLTSSVNRQGCTIAGQHTAAHYTAILRQLHYANRKPAYYLNRAFKVSCNRAPGKYSSNEYLQTVTVIHPQLSMDRSAAIAATTEEEDTLAESEHQATLADTLSEDAIEDLSADATVLEDTQDSHSPSMSRHSVQHAQIRPSQLDQLAAQGSGHAVTIIVVVCGGFLVVLSALVTLRARAHHSRSAGTNRRTCGANRRASTTAAAGGSVGRIVAGCSDDPEMAWDDSPLNITLNPMELAAGCSLKSPADDQTTDEDQTDDEPSDDSSSDEDENDVIEIMTAEGSNHPAHPRRSTTAGPHSLEWDDSTLH